MDARSLYVGGSVAPFCARCTGTYVGILGAVLLLGCAGALTRRRLPPRWQMALLSLPWIIAGAAWVLEFGGLDILGNVGRALVGLACGASGTVLLAPLFARVIRPAGGSRRGAPASRALGIIIIGGCGTAMAHPAARYCCLAVLPAAGFVLTVFALNGLIAAALILEMGRRRWLGWGALAACAGASEIAIISSLRAWLSAF